MYVAALNIYRCRGGVEVLILQFAFISAVHRVGEVGAESLHVEVIDTAADLLVGGEAYAYLAVAYLGMCHEILGCGHDLGTARLVIGPEQRRAVGMDDGVTLEERQLGKIRHMHRQRGIELYVAAVVILYDVRMHILAAHVGRGVDV